MGAFTSTINGLEDAGIKLIDSISGGIVKIGKGLGNTTEGLIESTSKGVSEIIDSIGGLPTIILGVVEIAIVAYLIWLRVQDRPRTEIEVVRASPEVQKQVQVISTPLDIHNRSTTKGTKI